MYSDQTATTLTALFAYLARYSKYQAQIFDEIKKISSVTEFLAVLRLPVLKSVIMETLRLWPPLPTGVGRIVPAGGLTIAGRYIPGGTTILAPRYSIARWGQLPCFAIDEDLLTVISGELLREG